MSAKNSFLSGQDLLNTLSLNEIRTFRNLIIKKVLTFDDIDREKIRNEYAVHSHVYDHHDTLTSEPFHPEEDGEYTYLAQMKIEGRPWKSGDDLWSLAESLAKLHRVGIVHNDLSSDNVFVTPSGSVVFLDWGEAYFSSSPTLLMETRLVEGNEPILEHDLGTLQNMYNYFRNA